jgi:hypothetical protein
MQAWDIRAPEQEEAQETGPDRSACVVISWQSALTTLVVPSTVEICEKKLFRRRKLAKLTQGSWRRDLRLASTDGSGSAETCLT